MKATGSPPGGRGLVRSDDRLSYKALRWLPKTDEDRMLDRIAETVERINAKRPAQESLPDDRPPATA